MCQPKTINQSPATYVCRWLQNNRIESIDKGAFAGMASLFKLYDLCRCAIMVIIDRKLDRSLSYNHIASVEIGMFCGMSSLAELYVICRADHARLDPNMHADVMISAQMVGLQSYPDD